MNRDTTKTLVIAAALVLCLSASALAQEHSYGKEDFHHQEYAPADHGGLDPEISKMHPFDSSYFRHGQEVNRLASRPRIRTGEMKQKEEEALRFNFLYFIFQKFKVSDIID